MCSSDLISLFFVAVGMLVQVEFLREHPALALGGVVGVMGGKALLAAVGPALMGYSGRVALLAGLAVSQIGEFSSCWRAKAEGPGCSPRASTRRFSRWPC